MQDDYQRTLDVPLVCGRCSQEYAERANMGQWRCSGHIGDINLHGPGDRHGFGVWECCGAPHNDYAARNGCVPMDHIYGTTRPYTQQDDAFVAPRWLARFMPRPRSNAVVPRDEVRRCYEQGGPPPTLAAAAAAAGSIVDIDETTLDGYVPGAHTGPGSTRNLIDFDAMAVVRRYDWRVAQAMAAEGGW